MSEPNRLVDSRRVPGPSWWNDGPAVLLDLRTSDPERAVEAWHAALDALLEACPVPDLGPRCVRRYDGGATVGFEAPGSVLYDAVDLDEYAAANGVKFTSVRTTAAGRERMVNLVMQVPGDWTVARAHDRADEVEVGVAEALGGAETIVHVEPLGHPTRTGPLTV